jgi:hypothetical protein
MAEFNIKQQQAYVIQQAEVINNEGSVTWEDASERLRRLAPEVQNLIAVGQVDGQVGADLQSAISQAEVAKDKKSRIRALVEAKNIALGVSILSGISQTIGEIIQLLAR